MHKVIFIGPSAEGINKSLFLSQGYSVLPPVRRGDIEKLSRDVKEIIIVDGLFHSVASVGHIEIRKKIDNGVKVIGCSSMGAIRAYELKEMGMIGHGEVFEYFLNEDDFTDDEVTQLHRHDETGYSSITEPLVNLRDFFKKLVSENVITKPDSIESISTFKKKYYGERFLSDYVHAIQALTDGDPLHIRTEFCNQRIKQKDILSLMKIQEKYCVDSTTS